MNCYHQQTMNCRKDVTDWLLNVQKEPEILDISIVAEIWMKKCKKHGPLTWCEFLLHLQWILYGEDCYFTLYTTLLSSFIVWRFKVYSLHTLLASHHSLFVTFPFTLLASHCSLSLHPLHFLLLLIPCLSLHNVLASRHLLLGALSFTLLTTHSLFVTLPFTLLASHHSLFVTLPFTRLSLFTTRCFVLYTTRHSSFIVWYFAIDITRPTRFIFWHLGRYRLNIFVRTGVQSNVVTSYARGTNYDERLYG